MGHGRGQTAAERAHAAAARAELAGKRAAELRSRLESLTAGHHPSPWTSNTAQAAYDQSVLHADAARRSAMVAFTRAADAHRAAAGAAQRRGNLARALQHRDLAAADDLCAAALAETDD